MRRAGEALTRLTAPVELGYRVRGKLRAGGLFARHAKLARRAGIDGLYLVVSFDCDTPDDIAVAWKLHERMRSLGVLPVYAVPGKLLMEGRDVYSRIAGSGAEFINHGFDDHAYFDEELGRYVSRFFYDELSRDDVNADVERGHENLKSVLGVEPRGFRAPHFGTFQQPEQLRYLHRVLKRLGYDYSSSTVPLYGFRHGPVFDSFGLLEFPVSGAATAPLDILDSWGCFAAPDRIRGPEDYRAEGEAVAKELDRAGAGILNFYADPLHVHDSDLFFEVVEAWASYARPTTYSELVRALS